MPVSLEASNLEVSSLVIGCVSERKQQQAERAAHAHAVQHLQVRGSPSACTCWGAFPEVALRRTSCMA